MQIHFKIAYEILALIFAKVIIEMDMVTMNPLDIFNYNYNAINNSNSDYGDIGREFVNLV